MKVVFIRQGHNQRAAALPLTASEGEWHKNTCRRPTPPETEPGRNSNPYGSTVLENRHFYLKKKQQQKHYSIYIISSGAAESQAKPQPPCV